jgi:hypothetical protein
VLTVACGGPDRGRVDEYAAPAREEDPCAAEDDATYERYCAQTQEELNQLCVEVEREEGGGFLLYDDFEFGAAGGWYTNNDRCERCQKLADLLRASPNAALQSEYDDCVIPCAEAQTPFWGEKPVPAEQIPHGRCSSQYAVHITSGPFTDWGGQFGTSITAPLNDAGPCEGISFWARVGPGSGLGLRVQFSDRFTDEETSKKVFAQRDALRAQKEALEALEDPSDEELDELKAVTEDLEVTEAKAAEACLPDTTDDNPDEGCDKWGSFVTLSQEWEFYRLPFLEMRQAGWGKTAPDFETWDLKSMAFMYGIGMWDVWIDDIAYYGCDNG